MSRACVFLCLLFCGCGTTPRETIPLGGSTLSPVAAGNTFTYTFVLDNATNGVHAEGTIDGLSVPYSDSNIAGAVAEVMTMTSSKRTQNGFPIEPVVTTTTTVCGLDATGYTSLLLAKGTDGRMKYVTSPAGGAPSWPAGGAIYVGLSHSTGPVTFDDGSSESASGVVAVTEVVDVPYGHFETYRIEYSSTSTDGSGTLVENGTKWTHPKFGLIRTEGTFRSSNGVSTCVWELQATNTPL